MIRCIVETAWVLEGGMYAADAARRYPGEWSDLSGQPDAQIPANLDNVIFAGRLTADVFAQIAADPLITVISSQAEA